MACIADAVSGLLARYQGPERRAHSLATARLAAELCRRFDVEALQGTVAGLAHDVARDLADYVTGRPGTGTLARDALALYHELGGD